MGTLIFKETGAQYPIDIEGIENLVREHAPTSKRTNGAQLQVNFNNAEYPFSVVVNVPSEGANILTDAYKKRNA